MDTELQAMMTIEEALSDLDEDSKGRVLRWAFDRHKLEQPSGSGRPVAGEVSQNREEVAEVTDLADLYHRASPKTDAERALVVAYWVQQADDSGYFEGFRVNTELKNLGHGLSNVTRALGALMSQRPTPVIQVRKSGTSKQARKRYRVTEEGVRRVGEMMSSSGTSAS